MSPVRTGRRDRDAAELALDDRMMKAALITAARGAGRTHPNPSVGAVVFCGDQILGRGTTRPPGGPHAEIVAMDRAAKRHGASALRGASLAVTLEPCSFQGRTGPCSDAIIAAGITRVVAGCRDPHPRVAGRGFRKLRAAGISVTTGVQVDACREQHRGFLSVCERGRPWVTLKLAATLDGRIATASGESKWITGPASRALVHRLRDAHDAVMVGSETALVDDPALTVRRGNRVVRTPIRVLIDGRLRVPASAKLLSDGEAERTWVVCAAGARGVRAARAAAGRVVEVPRSEGGHVDLADAMLQLAGAGLTTLLLEGGGGLAAAMLRADLVDEVHWMLAPKLIGGDGREALGPLSLKRLAEAINLERIQTTRQGEDIHVRGIVQRSAQISVKSARRKSSATSSPASPSTRSRVARKGRKRKSAS
jgi:diaminohydroxyphosphoribosylaminopyrimidine deaminase/5-amino-6-(5-phosphoribosylamino)uracil reductase